MTDEINYRLISGEIKELFEAETLQNAIKLSRGIYEKHRMICGDFLNHKPQLSRNHSLEELVIYTEKFIEFKEQKKLALVVQKHNDDLMENITREVVFRGKKAVGFFKLPTVVQEKVWDKAWKSKHTEGYYNIFLELEELIKLVKGV